MRAKTVQGITTAIKKHLRWDKGRQPDGSRIMCRSITGIKLHTWAGLVGYCCKDLHEQHFQVCTMPGPARRCFVVAIDLLICTMLQVILHNITQEDMELGQVQYVMYGKDLEKNRCLHLPHNFTCRIAPGRKVFADQVLGFAGALSRSPISGPGLVFSIGSTFSGCMRPCHMFSCVWCVAGISIRRAPG